MSSKQKKALYRIGIAAALYIAAQLLVLPDTARFAVFLGAYLIIGGDVLRRAVRNIAHGQMFDENFLMSIATIGAFCIRDYAEGVAVMLFYQIGELFQQYAVGRSRQSIAALMDIRPDYATIEEDGVLRQVDPETIAVGDFIVIKPGERVPLDGVVVAGASALDTAALTGEALPREVTVGDTLLSGCINLSGLLRVQVSQVFGESTVAKILDLVENASSKKAKTEGFITRFAQYYTPAVVLGAAALAILPPLLWGGAWGEWIERALVFLVISCPCALVISIPLSFFGGIGGASKHGILVKGGNDLEALAKTEGVVFDKTGTLTQGTFRVTAVHPGPVTEERLLELAALAESFSNHPISRSLRDAYRQEIDGTRVEETQELVGRGVTARVDGVRVAAGNARLMEEIGATWQGCHLDGTVIHVAVNGEYAGHIVISDEVKADSAAAIAALRRRGIRRIVLLTGDTQAVGERVAKELGIDEVHAQLLPADKVEWVEQLMAQQSNGGKLVFVGDGINDAPVLSRADIGIAMGGMGSDAAMEAADIVLMDDHPSKIPIAIDIAKRTLRIVRQNIVFALGVKALVLILGAFGMANMWEAVFADVGVSVIAILNATRALTYREKSV